MYTNYLDTLTMYYSCNYDIRHLFTTHWIRDKRVKNAHLHHFCIKTDHAFLRYYPDMYGFKRLYLTCSLPKLYHQCNSNTFNITDYDNQTFMKILQAELWKVMDISKFPTTLSEWQPSRTDLFRMRAIDPVDRLEYHYGYGRLTYRGATTTTYKNTNYLPSSSNSKHPCIILRTYNKTKEVLDKSALLQGHLPSQIEAEHEQLMWQLDIPYDQFRYEFVLKRNIIKKYCDKYNLPVNMETIMNETFQKDVLNDLVISRGLHRLICSKRDFQKIVNTIFTQKRSIDNALKLAESIRNKKPCPLSPSQQRRIQKKLNSYNVNTATTNFVTITGLKLLQ